MAAPGTTGSHSTSSRVIRLFLAQPLDVIRSIRSSYSSNNVYVLCCLIGATDDKTPPSCERVDFDLSLI